LSSGGLSNYLYACSIDATRFKQIDQEPNKILLRLYGENNNKNSSVLLKDVVVSAMMSDNQLGPKLYGIFPSGRLEQFINANSMALSDTFDPELSRGIGQVMAKFHTLEMPFIKEPHWLFDTTAKYLRKIKGIQFTAEKDIQMFQKLQVFDFDEEFRQLK
jgi:choline/ethanolamine kinase